MAVSHPRIRLCWRNDSVAIDVSPQLQITAGFYEPEGDHCC